MSDTPTQAKPSLSNVARQKLHRDKMTAAGFIPATVFIPAAMLPDLRAAAAIARADPEWTIGRMQHRRSGRLCGMRGPKA